MLSHIKRPKVNQEKFYRENPEIGREISEGEKEYLRGMGVAHYKRYILALHLSSDERKKILEELRETGLAAMV